MGQTKYRYRTKQFFKEFKKLGFHPTDIEYLDGYFLFEYGKDRVVHFHIKECPGWKFAIWWIWQNEQGEAVEDNEGELRVVFFTQWEKGINKFKPTASTFVTPYYTYDETDAASLASYYYVPIMEFIKKHPYVARVYDRGWERNCWEYVTPFEAWKELVWSDLKERRRNRQEERFLKREAKLMDKIGKVLFDEYYVQRFRDTSPQLVLFASYRYSGWRKVKPDELPKSLVRKIKKHDEHFHKGKGANGQYLESLYVRLLKEKDYKDRVKRWRKK